MAWSADRPALVRIPFSHFCRKAEWGLTQAGIPYDGWNLLPHATLALQGCTRHGLVPILLGHEGMIEGSERILAWAERHGAPGTPALYPDEVAQAVRDWEDWAGETIGPVARREAYRVAYEEPGRFTDKRRMHVAARLARWPILAILKYTRARRHEDEDAAAVPRILQRVTDRLEAAGTGYLFTDHATAADIATAALAEPLLWAAPARDYATLDGWEALVPFIERVRPAKVARHRSVWMRRKHWRTLEAMGRREQEEREEEGEKDGPSRPTR